MNLLEMVCVLFAVVFFTSVALLYNNSAFRQREHLYDANSFVQASILAHEVLDEVDAKLFCKALSFSQIVTRYNINRTRNLDYVGETYFLQIAAAQVDSTGVPLEEESTANLFTKVSVTVLPAAGMKHSLSMSRIYTKTHLNLQ